MRRGTLTLTMRKSRGAETWPSFERDVPAQPLEIDGGDDFCQCPTDHCGIRDGTLDMEGCYGASPGGVGEGAV